MPNGQIGMVPLKGDRPMTQEEFEKLSDEQKQEMTRRQREVAQQVDDELDHLPFSSISTTPT